MTQVMVNLFHQSRQKVGKISSPLASSDVKFYTHDLKWTESSFLIVRGQFAN